MDLVLNILLLVVGFVSIIPLINLFGTSRKSKYRCLKFLINTTFIWTFIVFIERFTTNMTVIYYSHLLTYPIKFLLAVFMLCTIYNYVEKKMPKWQIYTLGALFIAEYLIAITNVYTKFIIKLEPADLVSFEGLYTADNGPLFIYHLLITYLVLFSAIVYLFVFLRKNKDIRHYSAISRTMTYSVIIVLTFNILQLTVFKSSVDLTYVSLVIVVFALYIVIYRKDMIFNLRTSGRGNILTNMREMYILTDSQKRVVEISQLLLSKYEIDEDNFIGKPLNGLIKQLENSVVLYTEYEVNNNATTNKDQLHIREKKFSLKGMNDFGYMILIYDETQVFTLLRELNRLSNIDQMTGLNNRNYIENKLETYVDKTNLGVLSLDLNGLKVNNDYLGHERGDYLLKTLSNNMKIALEDIQLKEMARIGGDEFLIVLEDTTLENTKMIRQKILDLCESEELLEKISVSIGIAYDNSNKLSIYQLIKQADDDMYRMKKEVTQNYAKSIVEHAKKIDKFIR